MKSNRHQHSKLIHSVPCWNSIIHVPTCWRCDSWLCHFCWNHLQICRWLYCQWTDCSDRSAWNIIGCCWVSDLVVIVVVNCRIGLPPCLLIPVVYGNSRCVDYLLLAWRKSWCGCGNAFWRCCCDWLCEGRAGDWIRFSDYGCFRHDGKGWKLLYNFSWRWINRIALNWRW